MDMGDILNQWDDLQKAKIKKQKESGKNQVSHKKANAPTAEEKAKARENNFEAKLEAQMEADNSKQINPMELWLRRYGVVDKDKIAEANQENENLKDRNYLINMRPEARIDLHGLRQEEARERLDLFVGDCKKRGLRKILIVHGKGIHTTGTDPVLGELVRRFIEQDKRLGMSGHPKTKAEGGTGATWVIIK